MKKLLYLLLFIPFGVFGQTQVVNVGTTANDHTGDPLRTAFIKVNTNFAAVRDSFGNIYREPQTRAVINDTLDDRMAKAIDIDNYLSDFAGTGGSVGMYELRGIVGTTSGFPVNGDSLVINTGFISHPHLQVYRDGSMQWYNSGLTNNTGILEDTYVFNSTTGAVIVRPVFLTGEKIIVTAFDPIIWHDLIPEGGAGGGGGSGASDLLTDLIAYYQMNESSGTVMVDALGVNNGVTSATVNQTGKIGKGYLFDTNTDDCDIPYDASMLLSGSVMTVGMWVNCTSLPGVGTYGYLYNMTYDAPTYFTTTFYVTETGAVVFHVRNTTTTDYVASTAAGAITTSALIHVAVVVNGANPLKIYINGTDVAVAPETFSGTFLQHTGDVYVGNSGGSADDAFMGLIDEVYIRNSALSQAQVQDLMTKTYPFN